MINILTCLFFKFSFVALLHILFCFTLRTYIQIKYHHVPLQYCDNLRKEALLSYPYMSQMLNPNTEGVPAPHLTEGRYDSGPPLVNEVLMGKMSWNFCVTYHVSEIPWINPPLFSNRVNGIKSAGGNVKILSDFEQLHRRGVQLEKTH